jgi:DNA repair exonuclease SbcCD nuclease subunit
MHNKIIVLVLSILSIIGFSTLVNLRVAYGTVRFVVVGDTRDDLSVNTTILKEVVQATIDESADFILIAGDLVKGSSSQDELELQLTTWRTIMKPLYNKSIGVYPCRGNHDMGSKAAWDNVFSGPYAMPDNGPPGEKNITYSFTHGNVFIVALDQYVTSRRVNQTWLDTQFAINHEPHIFVFGHEPAFKVNHSSCLDNYLANRNDFWESIAAEGGRIYLAGHDHFYDHSRLDDGDGNPNNDLHQYIVGHGGAPLYIDGSYDGNNGFWTPQRIHHESEYGYVLVVVDDLSVTVTNKHRTAPGVFEAGDEFIYTAIIPPN